MSNYEIFETELASAMTEAFRNDDEVRYEKAKQAIDWKSAELARRITEALANGTGMKGMKEGACVKATVKKFGIEPTYKAIKEFLTEK